MDFDIIPVEHGIDGRSSARGADVLDIGGNREALIRVWLARCELDSTPISKRSDIWCRTRNQRISYENVQCAVTIDVSKRRRSPSTMWHVHLVGPPLADTRLCTRVTIPRP